MTVDDLGEAAWTAVDLHPVLVDSRYRPTLVRRDRAARAAVLYSRGLVAREVGAVLGISRSYAASLRSDPDGAKDRLRKTRYSGRCVECGAATSGADGRALAPKLCGACQIEKKHVDRLWTRDTVIAALRGAAEFLGRTPTAVDAMRSASLRAKLSVARNDELDEVAAAVARGDLRLPAPWVAARECGSWVASIEAAGLAPAPLGGAAHRRNGHSPGRTPPAR